MFKQLSIFDMVQPVEEEKQQDKKNEPTHEIDTAKLAKHYYGIGEVAEMFSVNTSLLRFWEKEFPNLFSSLRKNKKGDRFYAKKEIENLKILFHLIKEKRMTLEGTRDYLKNNRKKVKDDRTILENLNSIRGFLVDLKNKLNS